MIQLSKLTAFAKANGLPVADEPKPDERPIPLLTINGKPALELPGNGRTLGDFAEEIGTLLAPQNIFARKGCAFTVAADGTRFEPANPTWLRSWAEKFVVCYRARETENAAFNLVSTMSQDAAKVVLEAPQFLEQLRRVERFHPCRMPVLRKDRKIDLLPEGHDPESATYTQAGCAYELDMSADRAKAVFREAFGEFPFADSGGRSRAVAVAAMMTVYAGGIMPAGSLRPVFLYLANAEGSGKTVCARLAGICYGAAPVEAAPTDEGEWQKKILSAVIGGRRLLLLDNLKGSLDSACLESYTTASSFAGRILGVSKEFSGEACATILITGNRLTISPDMRRRALIVELFTSELRSEDRKFARRLDDPALVELRPQLLAACWALVRSWDEAGRPPASRDNASFSRWCDTVAGIVEHAGFGCPSAPATVEGMGDTDTADISKMGGEMVPGTRYTFAQIVELCDDNGLFERFLLVRERDGELSRSAKSAFPKTLKRYDRRTVAPKTTFFIEGEGHQRRYFVK